jgi:DNA-binding transcriptional MerR regulator
VPYLKTPVAARQLGITYHRLMGLIRFGKINPPARDSSGDYLWSDTDLERARLALTAGRSKATAGGPTHAA